MPSLACAVALAAAPLLIGAQDIVANNGDVYGVVEQVAYTSTKVGPKGHDTFRLSLHLAKTAGNIYTIFGDEEKAPIIMPPAYQVPAPFGANMGGVNKAFYQFPGKYAEFDSWLTVGMTGAESTNSLGSVGVDFAHWDETHGLHTTDGAVFWMNPDDGPTESDTNGKGGKGAPSGGNIAIAQLTVATGKSFDAKVNCQGHDTKGNNWRAMGVMFKGGPITGDRCTADQEASISTCTRGCGTCKTKLDDLKKATVGKGGSSCIDRSGETAEFVMNSAIASCEGGH